VEEVIVMRRFSVVAAAAAAVLLVACGNESGAEGQPTMPSSGSSSANPGTPEPSETPGTREPSETPPGTPEPTGGPVEVAKADLAKRLGVAASEVTVVSSTEVTWSDGSLGCPQPGMNYTQALVEGFRVILEAAGKQYHYHSAGSRAPFLCTNPQG
jgi:hypothetical protein